METHEGKSVTFMPSNDIGNQSLPVSTHDSRTTNVGNYSDYNATAYGELHIEPIGFSTPGGRDPGPLSTGPLSSLASKGSRAGFEPYSGSTHTSQHSNRRSPAHTLTPKEYLFEGNRSSNASRGHDLESELSQHYVCDMNSQPGTLPLNLDHQTNNVHAALTSNRSHFNMTQSSFPNTYTKLIGSDQLDTFQVSSASMFADISRQNVPSIYTNPNCISVMTPTEKRHALHVNTSRENYVNQTRNANATEEIASLLLQLRTQMHQEMQETQRQMKQQILQMQEQMQCLVLQHHQAEHTVTDQSKLEKQDTTQLQHRMLQQKQQTRYSGFDVPAIVSLPYPSSQMQLSQVPATYVTQHSNQATDPLMLHADVNNHSIASAAEQLSTQLTTGCINTSETTPAYFQPTSAMLETQVTPTHLAMPSGNNPWDTIQKGQNKNVRTPSSEMYRATGYSASVVDTRQQQTHCSNSKLHSGDILVTQPSNQISTGFPAGISLPQTNFITSRLQNVAETQPLTSMDNNVLQGSYKMTSAVDMTNTDPQQHRQMPFSYYQSFAPQSHSLLPTINLPTNQAMTPQQQNRNNLTGNSHANVTLTPALPAIYASTTQGFNPQGINTGQCTANVSQQNAAMVNCGQGNTTPVTHTSTSVSQTSHHPIINKKEILPETFDGSGKTEWSDYIVHFEQCASYNLWSEPQKAQMLSICLRGEAQKLLSGLTVYQLCNYGTLKSILADRYDPKEKEVTYRCQFRYRRREKGESVSDYGYELNKLAQKAYPNLTLSQLEVHVIDQFINGLGSHELQKHVQFRHPKALHEAIGLATEYEALEDSIDRVKKPVPEQERIAPIISNTSNQHCKPDLTIDQISQLIDKKLDTFTANRNQRSRSPSVDRDLCNTRQQENRNQSSIEPKSFSNRNARQTRMFCTYCKRRNHTVDNCFIRQYDEKNKADKDEKSQPSYAITSQASDINCPIPTIIITPSEAPDCNSQAKSENQRKENINQTKTRQNANSRDSTTVLNMTDNISEEINVNTSLNSCLYLHADLLSTNSKLLLDTGSPYSILSTKMYLKLQSVVCLNRTNNDVKLKAADGSYIETCGKTDITFESDGHKFHQEFIIANIQGIDGIVGIDFLTVYDGQIKIKKQILKTSLGKIKIYKQNTHTCARIQAVDTVLIKPNAETFLKATIEQPCIKNESLSVVEPSKYLLHKGCLIAKTLVNPNDEEVIMSVLNLSDQSVKVNQNAFIGSLEKVDSVYYSENKDSNKPEILDLPEHLEPLIQNASSELTCEEKQRLRQLIIQYQDIFMQPDGKLGQTHIVEHEINTGNHKPIKLPPRRIPIFKRNAVDQELDKMLADGIIEPSDSPWSAPICLVKKKDGSCRFCIDFRKLNAVTLKDAYPLPRIDDTLDSLSGSMWFSTLDLASGYWQIKMSEASKKKTAFVTPNRGLFHFKVMPFGLTNAPGSFQRLMEKVLINLTPHKCLCYLDDIIILGHTFDVALENLKDVFQRLKEANLKLKPKKCSLFCTTVTYLGHVVSNAGITCDPSKIESVENWPTPSNKTEVRSILGLMGYYRKFIPNFAEIAKPLTRLTRKPARFSWNNECENSFQLLKQCLVMAPILAFPRETGIFLLDTDASLYGIGGILSQIQDGEEKVIAYASRTLNPAQQHYCTTKRELLAIVTFMSHFKHYLLGQKFIIRTDHAPLVWLRNFKEPEGLIARWLSIIETFNFEIQYRPGRQHRNVDCLSRKPKRRCPNGSCQDCSLTLREVRKDKDEGSDVENSVPTTDLTKDAGCSYLSLDSPSSLAPGPIDKKTAAPSVASQTKDSILSYLSLISPLLETAGTELDMNEPNWLPSWSQEELQQLQREDPSLKFVLDSKQRQEEKPPLGEIDQTDKALKTLWHQWESLEVKNGILYRNWKDSKGSTIFQLLAPESIKKIVFTNLHSKPTSGNLGRDRTLEYIKRYFYWPGMKADVERWIKSCDLCARAKPGPGLGKSPLQQFRVNEIMQCVALDIFGPLPISENGNEYIIVLGEYFSKWVDAWAVPNHTAQTVADKLVTEFFTKFGCPRQIHTDQGREFQSELFKLLCDKFEINQTRTAPYRPNSDGLVERFNRTLKQMLGIFATENPRNWDDYLPYLLMAYRATQNKSTGCTPNLIFLQREITCPIELMVGPPPNSLEDVCPIQYIEWVKSAMEITHQFVFKNLGIAAKRQKFYYDRGLKPRNYQEGAWVWRWYPPTANQKLNLGWTGPYLVIKQISETTYSIQKAPDKPIINVHVDHIKPYEGETELRNWLVQSEGNDQARLSVNGETEDEQINESTEETLDADRNVDTEYLQAAAHSQRPVIRSRRERKIKPKQIWSPS